MIASKALTIATLTLVLQRSSDAAAVNGNAASVPPGGASKYFVSMFNRLHDGGGLDSINQRLQALVDSDDVSVPAMPPVYICMCV